MKEVFGMGTILVTGGSGFIGSNFIKCFHEKFDDFDIVNMDKLTYAGNLNNLKDMEGSPRYRFIRGDICNSKLVDYVLEKYNPNYIINFAAESHVDRSISQPSVFGHTNFLGTLTLLQGACHIRKRQRFNENMFIQISTDEVYGSIENNTDCFAEESNLAPNSPYSASKAGADLMVRAFSKTYGIPAIITRCCNNYGPYQNAEKFIPKCITNVLKDEPIPIYGSGKNIREWIHVLDHCSAIINALFYGKPGEVYNIGSGEEISNIEMARKILMYMGKSEDLIKMVEDRPGHDNRYAVDSSKIKSSTKWEVKYKMDEGIKETIKWYEDNTDWWNKEG